MKVAWYIEAPRAPRHAFTRRAIEPHRQFVHCQPLRSLAHTFKPIALSLAIGALAGCAAQRPGEHEAITPLLLPFTYAPREDGAVNAGVRSILEDRDGNLWIGSHFEGVCRVAGARIDHFTVEDGLSDNQVRTIQQGPDGLIWFDNGVGVSCFDGSRIWAHASHAYPAMPTWSLHPDDLWFKAHESHGFTATEHAAGVHRLDAGTLTYLPLPLPAQLAGNTGYSVTGFAKGKGGRIWIATYDAVFGFDGASLTTIDGARMGLRDGEGVPHVRCVFEDSRGRVWIGNNGVGVVVVDGDATLGLAPLAGTGEALLRMGAPLTSNGGVNRDGSLQRVFSIGEDRDGNIWIGTIGGGAWRYDGRELRQFTAADGLTTANVMAIYRDRDGELWLGGAGVFRLEGERFERIY
jgi:ligand-binding sensor domain-containing protein